MSLLSRILGLWAVSRSVSATAPLFMRLLFGMAAITFFAVFAAVLVAIIAATGLWYSYGVLIAHGATPQIAIMILALVVLLLVIMAVMALQYYWNRVSELAKRLFYLQSPVYGRVHTIADAFMHGYHARTPS